MYYAGNTTANQSLRWKHWLFLWYCVVSSGLGFNWNVALSLSLSLSCFRGNHSRRFTVPILDHRHSSHAGRQEDRAFYNAPMRLSVRLRRRLDWRIISPVLHHFRQKSYWYAHNVVKYFFIVECFLSIYAFCSHCHALRKQSQLILPPTTSQPHTVIIDQVFTYLPVRSSVM